MMFDGCEQFIPGGVKDDTDDTPPLVFEANGDAISGVAMRKICGPIKWVDNPSIRGGSFVVTTSLFGQKMMIGKASLQMINHALFGGTVGIGDQIDGTFVFDLKAGFGIAK
jgi:hypothetical protein